MKNVAVFCGSKAGNKPEYADAVIQLGVSLAKKNLNIFFGGGSTGLMAALAEGVSSHNGSLIGVVITGQAAEEIPHPNITKLIQVNTTHDRKLLMFQSGEAYILVPGGLGSADEFFDIAATLNGKRVGKPIGILNVNNFYDPLMTLINLMVSDGFLKEEILRHIFVETNPEALTERILSHYHCQLF